MHRTVRAITTVAGGALLLGTLGCEAKKSENPLSPSIAGPIPWVDLTAPKALEPNRGVEIRRDHQPVKLLIENSSSNSPRPFWYIVEIATDARFKQRAYVNEKVTPQSGGRSTFAVPVTLAPERTYYWRVRADDGANSTTFSTAAHFQVITPVIIDPPVPISPVGGQTAPTTNPNLVVQNGGVSGPAGPVTYNFQVARDQAFTRMVTTRSIHRSSGGSTSVTAGSLPAGALLFWRARGSNGKVTSAFSRVEAFRTPAAPPPPPPSGGGGACPSPPGGGIVPGATTPNVFGKLQTYAAQSAHWPHCQQGSGLSCHLFTREAARKLHAEDANWGMLSKSPGEWQCTANACGSNLSCGYGEDVIVYRATNQVVDIIGGAGAPGAHLTWQFVPKRPNNHWVPPP